ncbi:MAG: DUF642 domain-containing protein [Candidatus Thiodiazotropha sp.]
MRYVSLKMMLPILLAGSAGITHAASLINGSFEQGNYTPPGADTMTLLPGSTDITGWLVHTDPIAWIGPNNPWSLTASEGDYFLDLTDYSTGAPFGGISQEIDTRIGQSYEVTFDLGSSNIWGRPSAIQVSAAVTSQVFASSTTGGISDWDNFSMLFTANSELTTISFAGHTGRQYIGLDNVAVNPVPIPAAVWLFGSALPILLGFRVRKKHNA